jgi:hypothetical protein
VFQVEACYISGLWCALAWFARVSEKLQSSEGDYAGGFKGYQLVPGVDISSPWAGYEKAMTLGRY